MNNTISACLIVKNEEKHIKRCLDSIKDIVDEIIVVDTGSTDKTIEIAKEIGAKIYHHKWEKNFSKARNVSLEKATMDWILYIDADEEIREEDRKRIKGILNNNLNYEGFYVRVLNIIEGKCSYEAAGVRLYKNNPKYRFKGKLHEQIINSIKEMRGLESIKETDIVFYHYGYDGNMSNLDKKNKRNIDILESYEEKDKDAYYYFVLGNEYGKIDEYKKAIGAYKKSLNNMDLEKYQYTYYPSLVMNIVKVLNNEKRFNDTINFIKKIKETTPGYKDLYFMECMSWIQCGKFSRAKESLEEYINCNEEQKYDYPISHFENQYNINLMRDKLENLSIKKEDDILSIMITVDEFSNKGLIETIKSINEVSENVVVVSNEDIDVDIEMVLNLRAQVIQIPKEIDDKKISIGRDACKGKYIMIMRSGDLSSPDINEKVLIMIENNNLNFIKGVNGEIIKIFRHDDISFKFNEYIQYLEQLGKVQTDDGKIKFDYDGVYFEFKELEEIEIFNEVFRNKEYEIVTNKECVVIDIGANVGIASIYFASNSNVKKVYSYEPFKLTYSCLLNNLKLNPDLQDKVQAYNYGLGKSDILGKGIFNEKLKGNSKITLLEEKPRSYNEHEGEYKIEEVEIKRAANILEDIIKEHKGIDIVIKMDCEGGEIEIFKDEKFIKLLVDTKSIIMETHTPESFVKICNILKRNEFTIQGRMVSRTNGYIKATKNCG
ncbi:FkbM family methyltransferase [Romboutsia sp.]|uniref:FkbM family methyltransferase n=1 Tax=Romboutsia sp. TaxID=1965302 RepID=UPI003F3CF375